MVNIGLIVDLRNPHQWRKDPSHLYGHTLDVCEEADRRGIHSIWTTEHHLFEDDYLPRPITFAAAIAARTSQARVGTAIAIAPLRSAASLAEDVAVVDLISAGRFELGFRVRGTAKSNSIFTKCHLRDDLIRLIGERRNLRLWDEGGVAPVPAQKPVPIWLGYQGVKGARRAGLLGTGLLSCKPELVTPYLDGLEEGGHDSSQGKMAGFLSMFVTEDPDRDWPIVSELWESQWNTYRQNGALHRSDAPPVDPEAARRAGIGANQGHLFFGTPEGGRCRNHRLPRRNSGRDRIHVCRPTRNAAGDDRAASRTDRWRTRPAPCQT